MHRSLLAVDTLDDRREIYHLLHRLSPRARVSFLAWCCTRVPASVKMRPVASPRMAPAVELAYRCAAADERLTAEVYGDLLAMAVVYDLDLAAAALELERRVRRPASPSSSASPP
jgi:hypothetical protein